MSPGKGREKKRTLHFPEKRKESSERRKKSRSFQARRKRSYRHQFKKPPKCFFAPTPNRVGVSSDQNFDQELHLASLTIPWIEVGSE